ncbi:MAG: CDF family Co(II)/Ni(II) efflux transporter DmeF [Rhodobacteraceae bacterium]|nr:CDF family Co(II)/Ni(II) efflux transporter DmeF [Paracoccaceae bacterium]MCF8514162.1 CDF family Co(II)/Ni(II) efflux transporter DmeF [Paracoccaceae bacterium]MCF8518406.1 CDF family Co(II)/Ni(II) efflux transporter DmeF [Paracoccaceae bacterium]
MHDHHPAPETAHLGVMDGPHGHVFLGKDHDRNARRTWAVIGITTVMMVIEITAGTIYGSMALVADGWHMSTHAAALMIAALSYAYARKNAQNPRFSFGTGKFGDLAGFASAVVLGIVALLIGWESFLRLSNPVNIDFGQATIVAVIGLVVNLACAALLHDGHGHSHGHGHGHSHDHGHHHHAATDNNLRAAYLHVMADALTSVLAIAALLAGRMYGWLWLDPAIGILGAAVIAHWSWGLLKQAGAVLVDYVPQDEELPEEITEALAREGDSIIDLHIWQLGPGHHGAIIALKSQHPEQPAAYRARLQHIHELSHVTIEVQQA